MRPKAPGCIQSTARDELSDVDLSRIDQYFELALDLPERQRARLLEQVDAEDRETGRQLRQLLDGSVQQDYQAMGLTKSGTMMR